MRLCTVLIQPPLQLQQNTQFLSTSKYAQGSVLEKDTYHRQAAPSLVDLSLNNSWPGQERLKQTMKGNLKVNTRVSIQLRHLPGLIRDLSQHRLKNGMKSVSYRRCLSFQCIHLDDEGGQTLCACLSARYLL